MREPRSSTSPLRTWNATMGVRRDSELTSPKGWRDAHSLLGGAPKGRWRRGLVVQRRGQLWARWVKTSKVPDQPPENDLVSLTERRKTDFHGKDLRESYGVVHGATLRDRQRAPPAQHLFLGFGLIDRDSPSMSAPSRGNFTGLTHAVNGAAHAAILLQWRRSKRLLQRKHSVASVASPRTWPAHRSLRGLVLWGTSMSPSLLSTTLARTELKRSRLGCAIARRTTGSGR